MSAGLDDEVVLGYAYGVLRAVRERERDVPRSSLGKKRRRKMEPVCESLRGTYEMQLYAAWQHLEKGCRINQSG